MHEKPIFFPVLIYIICEQIGLEQFFITKFTFKNTYTPIQCYPLATTESNTTTYAVVLLWPCSWVFEVGN